MCSPNDVSVAERLNAISRRMHRFDKPRLELIGDMENLEARAEKWRKSSDHYEHQATYLRGQLAECEEREIEHEVSD